MIPANNDISKWFREQIFLPRLLRAIAFQSFGATITTMVALSLLKLDLLHPFSSIYRAIFIWLSWRDWLISCICGIVVIPASFTASQLLTARNERLSDQLLADGNWSVIGFTALWTVCQALVEIIVASCCLNSSNVKSEMRGIVIYGVLAISLYSAACYILRRCYRLQFPIDLNYNVYKKQLASYVYERTYRSERVNIASSTGYGFAIFLITFLTFGWRINRSILGSPITTFIDSLWNCLICHPSITWAVFVFAVAVQYRLNLMAVTFDLFLCKPIQFILPSSDLPPVGQEKELLYSLGAALAVEKPTLLKYLAFADARLLTLHRHPRMQMLFTVSSPGGHPRCWLSVSSSMLHALRSQLKAFEDVNRKLAEAWKSKIEQTVANRGGGGGFGTAPVVITGRIPEAIPPKHWNREWKLQQQQQNAIVTPTNNYSYYCQQKSEWKSSIFQLLAKFRAKLSQLQSQSSSPFTFLRWFRPATMVIIGHEIWADLQMHLWNIEALGHIIASSYTDDKYGIIQRDLPTILGLLLDLYSESDRYSRLITSQRRIDQGEIDANLASLRDGLIDTVKRIHDAFGTNLNDVRLTDQERIILKRIVDGSFVTKI